MKQTITFGTLVANYWSARLFTLLFKRVLKPHSRFWRRIFEFKKVKQGVGIIMALAVLMLTTLPSLNIWTAWAAANAEEIEITAPEMTTEVGVRVPVAKFIYTQNFGLLHPGIDMATALGTDIYPVMDGVVEKAERERSGYGNHVIVDHGSGIKSLYAHMAQIKVKEGDKVRRYQVIGLVGSTGHSTGPHLHFQVWQDGKWVDPMVFMETGLGTTLLPAK